VDRYNPSFSAQSLRWGDPANRKFASLVPLPDLGYPNLYGQDVTEVGGPRSADALLAAGAR
jgi:hypothetical protein